MNTTYWCYSTGRGSTCAIVLTLLQGAWYAFLAMVVATLICTVFVVGVKTVRRAKRRARRRARARRRRNALLDE